MKYYDPGALLRRIPEKWRLPVMAGVGFLWLGLLAGVGWFFLDERKPERIIIDEEQLKKSPVADWAGLKLFYQAALHDVPLQLMSDGKSAEKFVGPGDYLDILRSLRLDPPALLTKLRPESPDYLIPNDRYNTGTAYRTFVRLADGMSMNKLLEVGSQNGTIWLDREFMEDIDPEMDDDGSMLICGDSREGEVCLAFLDSNYQKQAKGNASLKPDYKFIAATSSKDSARQEIALYRHLRDELPQVLAALAQEGLRAVSMEKMELRRNEKERAPACLVDVTVANTDPGQRDVEGIDFHCYILDTHGKPVEHIYIPGNERQRISAGRRPRTYTFKLEGIGDDQSRRLIKLLEGSYQLKIVPYARRLDGKETRELSSGSLPEGIIFQNGAWRYNNAPLSLKDVSPLLTVNRKYATADAERLKAEMEARRPTILRLATWVHNTAMRSLVAGVPQITFPKANQSILNLTLTNTNAHTQFEARLILAFANAEDYPCQVMRFGVNGMEFGDKKELSLNVSDSLPYFLLQEVQRGNCNLSIFACDISYYDLYPASVLERKDGKLEADVSAFYQRNGVWYYNGTALPAEAAECTETPLLEPDVSPEDEEDLKARYARHQSWFKEQRKRLAPLVFSRFVPHIQTSWYRSVERVQDGLWIDTTGDSDVWMLENKRIPDAIVQAAGLEAWPRNEARKGSTETDSASTNPSPAAATADAAAPTATTTATTAADDGLTPEAAPAGKNDSPAASPVVAEAVIAPSTPGDKPQAAASPLSRESIMAEVSLADSTAAHKVVFAIRFRNTSGQDAQVSYRTFFFESGKMFGRRESKMTIRVPAQSEQVLHLGSNKPDIVDIGKRMREGRVQMLVEIVDVEAAK